MKKSGVLSEQLKNLEVEASNMFSELLKSKDVFDFTLNESELNKFEDRVQELKEEWNLASLPTIEIRNDITGNVFDVHVLRIGEFGISTISMNDNIRNIYKFSDLCSLDDKLVLLNEMEELV